MAHTKTVAPNIKANIRDNGEITSYSTRVSINCKDVRRTFPTLDETIAERDRLLVKQAAAKRRKGAEGLNFKHWGYL